MTDKLLTEDAALELAKNKGDKILESVKTELNYLKNEDIHYNSDQMHSYTLLLDHNTVNISLHKNVVPKYFETKDTTSCFYFSCISFNIYISFEGIDKLLTNTLSWWADGSISFAPEIIREDQTND